MAACSPATPEVTLPGDRVQATPVPAPSPARDSVRFAAVGDVGENTPVARGVAAMITAEHEREPIDALLLLGDLVYPDGAGHRYEANFATPYRPVLDAGIRLAAVLGNHDIQTRAGADMMEAFGMPGRYYDFQIGPVAFFALDYRLDAGQLEWLDDRLSATVAPWKVLFLHVPPYSSGMHGSSLQVRRALDPVVERHGVQLVLAGHEHHYERTVRIGPAVYVVAGTGCCIRETGRSDFTAEALSAGGAVFVTGTPDDLSLEFLDTSGQPLDSTSLALTTIP